MNAVESQARRERWLLRAERINDAFGLVLVLVLITYVLASLLGDRGWDAVILGAAASATSVVALVSSHAHPRAVRAALALSILAIAFAAIAAASDEQTWLNVGSMIEICLLTVAMLAVLRRVVTSAEIGSRTILGAISFYTVLGILFTWVYATVDRIQDGTFFEGGHVASSGDRVGGGSARAPEVPVRDPGSGQGVDHHHRVSDQREVSGHRRR